MSMPNFEKTITFGTSCIIRDSSKADVKDSKVKETFQIDAIVVDAIVVEDVCKGYNNNVSGRYKICKSFTFIQIIFMR